MQEILLLKNNFTACIHDTTGRLSHPISFKLSEQMWLVTYWRNSFPQAEEILCPNNIKKDSEHAHLWSSVGGKSEILQAHL